MARSRASRFAVWGFVVLLVLMALPILLWQIDPVRQAFVQRVLESISGRLEDGDIRVGRVDGSLLDGLQVEDLEYDRGGVRLEIARGEIEYALAPLLRRQARIDRLRLEGVRLSLSPEPATSPSEALGLRLPLRIDAPDIIVTDGRVRIASAAGEHELRIDRFAGGITAESDRVVLRVDDLRGSLVEPEVDVVSARGTVAATWRAGAPTPAIDVDRLQVKLPHSRLHADGAARFCAGEAVNLAFRAAPLDPRDTAAVGNPFAVPVSATVRATGTLDALQWSAALDSTAGNLRAEGSAGVPFEARCRPNWAGIDGAAAGTVAALAPAQLLSAELPDAARRTLLSLDFAGSVTDAGRPGRSLSANFEGRRSLLSGRPVRAFDGRLTWRERRIAGRVDLATEDSAAQVAGEVNLRSERYDGEIRLAGADPGVWLGSRWAGAVDVRARIEGAGFDPETLTASLEVTGGRLRIGGVRGRRLFFDVRARDGLLTVRRGELDTNVADLRVEGTAPLRPGREGALRALVRMENAQAVADLFPGAITEPVSGRAFARVVAEGTLERMRVDIRLRADAPRLGETQAGAVFLDAESADFRPRALAGSLQTTLRVPGLVVGGTMVGDVEAAVSVEGERPRFAGTLFVAIARAEERSRLRGEFTYRAGRQTIVMDELALAFGGTRWQNEGRLVIESHSGPGGRNWTIENLALTSEGQRVALDGSLQGDGTLDVELLLNRLQLEPIADLTAAEDQLTGELNGSLQLTGTFERPTVTGAISAVDLRSGTVELDVLTATFGLDEGVLDTEIRLVQRAGTGMLRADLRIGVPGLTADDDWRQAPLEGTVQAEDLRLALLDAWIDEATFPAGRITVDLRVAGTLSDPQVEGVAQLREGAVRVAVTGVTYEDVRGDLFFQRGTAALRNFSARTGEGRLLAQATVDLTDPLNPGALAGEITARRFQAVDTRLAGGTVDARLSLVGSWREPVLVGGMTIRELEIRPRSGERELEPLEFSLPGLHVLGESKAPSQDVDRRQVRAPFFERVAVHVTIEAGRDVWVRADDMNLEWRGDLLVFKQAGEEYLRLVGDLESVRGFVVVQGRRLRLERGLVTFMGTAVLDPRLDLNLSYETPEYDITARVRGTIAMPRIELSSDPPLEDADVLAVLLFGRPFSELDQGEQTAMRDRVGAAVGGVAAGQLTRLLGARLPIDVLEVRTGDATTEGPGFGVGKYVTEDIFVQYVQRFGADADSELRLEYYFARRWLVVSSVGTSGESAVDVFWETAF